MTILKMYVDFLILNKDQLTSFLKWSSLFLTTLDLFIFGWGYLAGQRPDWALFIVSLLVAGLFFPFLCATLGYITEFQTYRRLNLGNYVFCTTKDLKQFNISEIILFFRADERLPLILEEQVADSLQLDYPFISSWITLTVHSSLEAVGLPVAFSKALTNENISCNVVAGYFYNHIFIDRKDAKKAMTILNKFSEE